METECSAPAVVAQYLLVHDRRGTGRLSHVDRISTSHLIRMENSNSHSQHRRLNHVKLVFKNAIRREVFWQAVKVMLIVGTILNLINHVDNFVHPTTFKPLDVLMMILTYLVPFFVSMFSAATVMATAQVRSMELDQLLGHDYGELEVELAAAEDGEG